MKRFLTALVPLAALALPLQAQADTPASAAAAFSAETVSARNAALAELDAAKAGDPLAAYAAGSVQFFVALEKLGVRPASPRLRKPAIVHAAADAAAGAGQSQPRAADL